MSPTPRIALIHAVEVAVAPINAAFDELWPEAERINLLEDALSLDRAREGGLSDTMIKRINALADYALLAGAQGVLFTCSAFGPAIEMAAKRLSVPVFKPNQAMFDAALSQGKNIGMLATFAPAIATMEAEFYEAAAKHEASIKTVLVEKALDALKSGDQDTHNRLVAEAALSLQDCDAIMLAHFSTSRAKKAVEEKLGRAVLTSPVAAVSALRHTVEGVRIC
ncbi:aspartate/glutamate racemase family protein [Brucellaceae bacterium D45D]